MEKQSEFFCPKPGKRRLIKDILPETSPQVIVDSQNDLAKFKQQIPSFSQSRESTTVCEKEDLSRHFNEIKEWRAKQSAELLQQPNFLSDPQQLPKTFKPQEQGGCQASSGPARRLRIKQQEVFETVLSNGSIVIDLDQLESNRESENKQNVLNSLPKMRKKVILKHTLYDNNGDKSQFTLYQDYQFGKNIQLEQTLLYQTEMDDDVDTDDDILGGALGKCKLEVLEVIQIAQNLKYKKQCWMQKLAFTQNMTVMDRCENPQNYNRNGVFIGYDKPRNPELNQSSRHPIELDKNQSL